MTLPRLAIAVVVMCFIGLIFCGCYTAAVVWDWCLSRWRGRMRAAVGVVDLSVVESKHATGHAANERRLDEVRREWLLSQEPEYAGQCWRMQ